MKEVILGLIVMVVITSIESKRVFDEDKNEYN